MGKKTIELQFMLCAAVSARIPWKTCVCNTDTLLRALPIQTGLQSQDTGDVQISLWDGKCHGS